MQNKFNPTEEKAFDWLVAQGNKDILYQKHSPYFIANGKSYEPKLLYGENVVVIHPKQLEAIIRNDATILVFGSGENPVAIIPAQEISLAPKTWHNIILKFPTYRYKPVPVTPTDILGLLGDIAQERSERKNNQKTVPTGWLGGRRVFKETNVPQSLLKPSDRLLFEAIKGISEGKFVEHDFEQLSEENQTRKEKAIVFNTYCLLRGSYQDISSGMVASWLKCSPIHVGAVLKQMGIQRENRTSSQHPRARFIVWNTRLMKNLFEQYGHEEFQAQFPDAKPYYKKPLPETLF